MNVGLPSAESQSQTTNPVLARMRGAPERAPRRNRSRAKGRGPVAHEDPLRVRPDSDTSGMDESQHTRRACPECGESYPLDESFTRNPRCRPCRAAYGRDHYRRNVDYYKAKARRRQMEVVNGNKQWLLDYLLEHPCVDCGEPDPLVLEFDHRDPATKVAAVSSLARSGYSLSAVQREVAQCDVRCANCHRRKTHEQRGWWGRARHDSNVQPFDP